LHPQSRQRSYKNCKQTKKQFSKKDCKKFARVKIDVTFASRNRAEFLLHIERKTKDNRGKHFRKKNFKFFLHS
jgi:hypothetical protein